MNKRNFLKSVVIVASALSAFVIAERVTQMTIPNKLFLSRLGRHEKQVLKAFDDKTDIVRFFIEEWHRRAHKTTLAINILIREACRYPKSKYVYIAPTQVWARNIVWDDPTMLWDALPDKSEMFWKPNEQKMLIKFANGSMFKIGGSDEPESLKGIDADGVVLDEYALHKPETWALVFRPIIAGPKKPGNRERWAMFLYTPKGINHATLMFNIAACVEDEAKLPTNGQAGKCKPGWFASRLIADESGIIHRAELDKMLEEVAQGTITIEDYDQEMQCRRVTDEERTLITSAMLARLDLIEWDIYRDRAKEIRRIVAIDPAFGGDLCSIKAFENGRELTQRGLKLKLTSEVAHVGKVVAEEIDTKNFIVDCIGDGKGVADYLADDVAGYDVQYFNSSEKTRVKGIKADVITDVNLYANRKAQAVAYAAKLIRRLKVESIADPETKRQLVALSRYKVTSSGKTIMILNDDVKKAIGCSPDKGLCWIYGQWGLQYVDPIRNEELDRYDEAMKDHRERKRRARRGSSPMRMA